MIIVRTPYRTSFFGGGTDYPAWYEQHGGMVLSATIDKYCYICLREMPAFLGSKYRIFWSKAETVDRVEDIEHAGVRGCLQYLGIDKGIEINHAGDLPARAGLGSSSAFTVGMIHALRAMEGMERGRPLLAADAIEVEQNVLQETVGIQDQIECATGGLNLIAIETDGSYSVSPCLRENIQDHLFLVFTGLQRHASEIAAEQVKALKEDELHKIAALVPEAVKALTDPKAFGELLDETWRLKRTLSDRITTDEIDEMYATAQWHGAYGGKVLGAGGGGFMLFCAPPGTHDAIAKALDRISIPVVFESHGSELILK